jgi:hypothetical protein
VPVWTLDQEGIDSLLLRSFAIGDDVSAHFVLLVR